jgi:Fe2+ or Zn2+ uptake regulation protein
MLKLSVTAGLRELLLSNDIQPSVQRLAVAEYVLTTDDHPSADQVWARTRARLPVLSRATVYNTLHLFVKKGLLRQVLAEGRVVFDAKTEAHHHFIDEATGHIYDLPWQALKVQKVDPLRGYEVHEYQVVMRGKRKLR